MRRSRTSTGARCAWCCPYLSHCGWAPHRRARALRAEMLEEMACATPVTHASRQHAGDCRDGVGGSSWHGRHCSAAIRASSGLRRNPPKRDMGGLAGSIAARFQWSDVVSAVSRDRERMIHFLTPEYLPRHGGVGDYTRQIATELGRAGETVHVWGPSGSVSEPSSAILVHPELGRFRPGDLRRANSLLDAYPSPRRLVVQWVPHGYGRRAMNVPFCLWLWRGRSRAIQSSSWCTSLS